MTPIEISLFTSAYGSYLKKINSKKKIKIVIGRDARVTGNLIKPIVINTLLFLGIDIIDIDLASTPTVAISIPLEKADGGIIISASHNLKEWNALKLLNRDGEFITSKDIIEVKRIFDKKDFNFSSIDLLGKTFTKNNYLDIHIDLILKLDSVYVDLIKSSKFKVVVDGINSVGGIAIPKLLKILGVEVIELFCDPNGEFKRNPEPLENNLNELSDLVIKNNADFGIAVDPDVDRLAFVDEKGIPFGEEYTLVACAYHLLSIKVGNSVSNLSSTHALKDVTENFGGNYYSSPVGEANVVKLMKEKNAVIGGEGNGGIILPEIHYGRDALVGTALFLSLLSSINKSTSQLKNEVLPKYHICKGKISLNNTKTIKIIFDKIKSQYIKSNLNLDDGVKIIFNDSWVHIRSSNTEPIIRIYSEAKTKDEAEKLNKKFKEKISELA
ncbi:MAG: phosphoglucosamine mutase [Flavobacteriaceae bacterium]